MKIFTAQDVNLRHFPLVRASYLPRDIHTVGVQVTPENIGQLALEFEAEICYELTGEPYFQFWAKRHEDRGGDRFINVYPENWIVPLYDELHVYRGYTFMSTFTSPAGGDLELGSTHSQFMTLGQAKRYMGIVDQPKWMEQEAAEIRFGPYEGPTPAEAAKRGLHALTNKLIGYGLGDVVRIKGSGDFGTVRRFTEASGVEVMMITGDRNHPCYIFNVTEVEAASDEDKERLKAWQNKLPKFELGDRVRWVQHNHEQAVGDVEQIIAPLHPSKEFSYDVNVDNVLWQVPEPDLEIANEETLRSLGDFKLKDRVFAGETGDRGTVEGFTDDGRIQVRMEGGGVFVFAPQELDHQV